MTILFFLSAWLFAGGVIVAAYRWVRAYRRATVFYVR